MTGRLKLLALSALLCLACLSCSDQDTASKLPPREPFQTMTTAQFQGMLASSQGPVAVAVMSASCAPCRKELPVVERLAQELHSKGLTVLGLSLDFDQPSLKRLLEDTGIQFPVYWTGEEAIGPLSIRYLPLIILVRDGQEVGRLEGLHSEEELRARFLELLQNP